MKPDYVEQVFLHKDVRGGKSVGFITGDDAPEEWIGAIVFSNGEWTFTGETYSYLNWKCLIMIADRLAILNAKQAKEKTPA